jgi:hypothetical protein
VLFLKPRKVAGSSFELALSKYAGPNCILTPLSEEGVRLENGYRGAQNFHKPLRQWSTKDIIKYAALRGRPKILTGHESAEIVKMHLGAEKFKNAFKVSIVRNPFSVARSLFFWEHRHLSKFTEGTKKNFNDWALREPQKLRWNYDQYFLNGDLCIDFMVQYEQLELQLQQLEATMPCFKDLAPTMGKMNAKRGVTPSINLRQFYSGMDTVVKLIELLNSEIIKNFGYSLDDD